MRILEKLYYEWYEAQGTCQPVTREVYERYEAAWERAEELLGDELSHELRGSFIEVMDTAGSHDFEAGFRLGAQLMLELKSSAQKP